MMLKLTFDIISEITKYLKGKDLNAFLHVNKICSLYANMKEEKYLEFTSELEKIIEFLNKYYLSIYFEKTYNPPVKRKVYYNGDYDNYACYIKNPYYEYDTDKGKYFGFYTVLRDEYESHYHEICDENPTKIHYYHVEISDDRSEKESYKLRSPYISKTIHEFIKFIMKEDINKIRFRLNLNLDSYKFLFDSKFAKYKKFIIEENDEYVSDKENIIEYCKNHCNFKISSDVLEPKVREYMCKEYDYTEYFDKMNNEINTLTNEQKKERENEWNELKHITQLMDNKCFITSHVFGVIINIDMLRKHFL